MTNFEGRASFLLLCFALVCCVNGDGRIQKIVNVLDFGAKPDGKSDSTQAFMTAWQTVCKSTTDESVFLVPHGNFMVSTMFFAGPCKAPNPVTIQLEGTMLAPTDASEFVNGDWLIFQDLVGINIVGGGSLDARGHKMWPFFVDCDVKPPPCVRFPATLQFSKVQNAVVENINLKNAMGYDANIMDSGNVSFKNVEIVAPAETPNKEGIHIATSNGIAISNTTMRHGNDCVSLVKQPTDAAINKLKCCP